MKRILTAVVLSCAVLSVWAGGNKNGGAFITGKVTCEGKGIENVVVTDGYRCVVTDK